MRHIGGVELLLVPGTRIPLWIRVQDRNVEIGNVILREGLVRRRLWIRGGQAAFVPGGHTVVTVPGSSGCYTAFGYGRDSRVLRITAPDGEVYWNMYCCPTCLANQGYVLRENETEFVMACELCGDEPWTVETSTKQRTT